MRFFVVIFLCLIFCYASVFANCKLQNENDSLISAVLQSIHRDSVSAYINQIQNFDNRFALSDNRKDVAIWIQNKFIEIGYVDAVLDSFFIDSLQFPHNSNTYYSTWQYNVVAKIVGSTDSTKNYVLGAHYDAIVYPGDYFGFVPGADDNASGVAAVFETARVFKKHDVKPAYNIHFVAFAAEEIYLHGSRHYAQKLADQNAEVVLMINNDMIAYKPDSLGADMFVMQKYPGTDWVETLVADIAGNYTSLGFVTDTTFIQYSDSYSFYLQGYDAVFFQEYDFNLNLHTVFDVVDSLDMDYCAEVIKISCGILLKENLVVTSPSVIETLYKVNLYPNPVSETLHLHILSSKDGCFDVHFFDIQGRLVSAFHDCFEIGNIYFSFDLKNLNSGLYTCSIRTKNHIETHKIVKL